MNSTGNVVIGTSLILFALGAFLSSAPTGDTAGKIGAGLAGVVFALSLGLVVKAYPRTTFSRGFLLGSALWSAWLILHSVALAMGHK